MVLKRFLSTYSMIIGLGLCIITTLAWADSSLSKDFQKANQLYSQGNYKQALENYKMIERFLFGKQSPSLYYNIGNTYYKLGNYPYALLYYLKAEKLDPYDKDLQQNIRLCREKLGLQQETGFFEYVSKMRLEFWVIILAILFWIEVAILLSSINTAYKITMVVFLSLLFALSSVGALLSYGWHNTKRYLVVERTKLFSGPSEKEKIVAVLDPGVVLKKVSQMRFWVKVKAPENITGWVDSSKLGDI